MNSLKVERIRRIHVGDFKIGEEEKASILEVLESGRITEGKKTREFEKFFSSFIGTSYCIALNSGTSALIAGLLALIYDNRFPKVKKGSKVITSPLTYVATSNSIILSGLEPVFVDIDRETFSIIPESIKELLENTKDPGKYSAILPVHLMGYPCDMETINEIAKEFDLCVFEDSAQAHGTIYNGKKTGALSLLAAFSFYIAHNIQAGEMGAITTDDYEIIRIIRKLKANGRVCDCPICVRTQGKCPYKDKDFDPRFKHDFIGYNFKTMDFQASLAITQLKKIDTILRKRRQNVKYLNDRLSKYSEILNLPKYSADISYLAYPIVLKEKSSISRNGLTKRLEEFGIETRPIFGCIPIDQPSYSFLKEEYKDRLPNAQYVSQKGFYIGCHQYLEREDLDYILYVFEKILINL